MQNITCRNAPKTLDRDWTQAYRPFRPWKLNSAQTKLLHLLKLDSETGDCRNAVVFYSFRSKILTWSFSTWVEFSYGGPRMFLYCETTATDLPYVLNYFLPPRSPHLHRWWRNVVVLLTKWLCRLSFADSQMSIVWQEADWHHRRRCWRHHHHQHRRIHATVYLHGQQLYQCAPWNHWQQSSSQLQSVKVYGWCCEVYMIFEGDKTTTMLAMQVCSRILIRTVYKLGYVKKICWWLQK